MNLFRGKSSPLSPGENPGQPTHCSSSPISSPGPLIHQNQPCLASRSISPTPKQLPGALKHLQPESFRTGVLGQKPPAKKMCFHQKVPPLPKDTDRRQVTSKHRKSSLFGRPRVAPGTKPVTKVASGDEPQREVEKSEPRVGRGGRDEAGPGERQGIAALGGVFWGSGFVGRSKVLGTGLQLQMPCSCLLKWSAVKRRRSVGTNTVVCFYA